MAGSSRRYPGDTVRQLVVRPLVRTFVLLLAFGLLANVVSARSRGGSGTVAIAVVVVVCAIGLLLGLVCVTLATAVHEAGHVLGAWLVGVRPAAIRIGPGCRVLTIRGRPEIEVSLPGVTSCTVFDPPLDPRSRGRFAVIMLAGPALNIVAGWVAWLIAGGWDLDTALVGFLRGDPGAGMLNFFTAICFLDAVGLLLPLRASTGQHTDGYALLAVGPAALAGRLPAAARDAVMRVTHGHTEMSIVRYLPLDRPESTRLRLQQVAMFIQRGQCREAYAAAAAPRRGGSRQELARLDSMLALSATSLRDRSLYGEAEAAAERALEYSPNEPFYLYLQAWIMAETGRAREALDVIRAALLSPRRDAVPAVAKYLDCLFVEAVIRLSDRSLYAEAEAASARAIEESPDQPDSRYLRGLILVETGRADEGGELLRGALSVLSTEKVPADGDVAEITAAIALGEARLGNVEDARRLLREAEDLDPECWLLDRVRDELP